MSEPELMSVKEIAAVDQAAQAEEETNKYRWISTHHVRCLCATAISLDRENRELRAAVTGMVSLVEKNTLVLSQTRSLEFWEEMQSDLAQALMIARAALAKGDAKP